MTNKKVETLDLTPSWPEALNVCLMLLENGDDKGKQTAKGELLNMAKVAQMHVDSQKQRTPEQSIRNFVYFSMNYPSNFIEECWKDYYDKTMVAHLREKFNMYYHAKGATGVMNEFICNLSEDHQIRLAKWIDDNYNEIK